MTDKQPKPIGLIIIGAQKSGTTSLRRYLEQHPDISFHARNEMNFFLPDEEYALGYDQAFKRHYEDYVGEDIIGAKYVDIMFSKTALDRLQEHNPDVRIVAILRNPVIRAYSAYWYCRRMGWEMNRHIREAMFRPFDPACRPLSNSWHCAYLARGHYHDQLSEVFARFKTEQVSIFLLDELHNNPLGVCQKIYKECGVDSDFQPDVSQIYNRARQSRSSTFSRLLINPSATKRRWRHLLPERLRRWSADLLMRLNTVEIEIPRMDPELNEELVAYFRPFNDRLGRLLGRDLSDWNV